MISVQCFKNLLNSGDAILWAVGGSSGVERAGGKPLRRSGVEEVCLARTDVGERAGDESGAFCREDSRTWDGIQYTAGAGLGAGRQKPFWPR